MAAAWAISFGLELAVYFWLGFDIAPKADRHFGTAPFLRILGYVIGIGCPINAFVRVIREYNRAQKQEEQEAKQEKPDNENRNDQHD